MNINENYIYLVTGKKFYFDNPKEEDINIEFIAHGLSNICRFCGQVDNFYSVAQHSVLVSEELEKSDYKKYALRGLLHDASESIIHDITRPFKRVIADLYNPIEEKIQNVIYKAFGLDPNNEEANNKVKYVDNRMVSTEIKELIYKRKEFTTKYEPYCEFKIYPWDWKYSKIKFLERFNQLKNETQI